MQTRKLGPFDVSAIGFGCMNLSHAYGPAQSREVSERVIGRALELGVTHFDTAALYGFGANEELIGALLGKRPPHVFVATKCGLFGRDGKRVIDGTPEAIRATVEQSLKNLRTETLDLLYLHRWDKKSVTIEESVGAMADLVRAGKVRHLGLSEVSAATLRKAHAVHPIAALQSEYSLWTRNPEIGALAACRELGVAFVAFSPLARGFLPGLLDPAKFPETDIRRTMPRFVGPNFEQNRALLPPLAAIAAETGCSLAQLALAWVLAKGPHVHVIPGTTQLSHVNENCGADAIRLDAATVARLDALMPPGSAAGERYPPVTQAENDTEQFGQTG
jgi:aryl-alcohol dehydrogenase-like predicted oxidoreductase